MKRNPWHGTIARLGVKSDDGRALTSLTLARLGHPRGLSRCDVDALDPTPQRIGVIDVIGVTADGYVTAKGYADLPPGKYAVAVDVRVEDSQTSDDGTTWLCGELLGATVTDGRDSVWDGVEITVEDEA